MAYNLETIIAEKFQAIIAIGILNSRMKDYYDIYYLLTYKRNEISDNILIKAITTTFEKRNTEVDNIHSTIEKISKSDFLNDRWQAYCKNHEFAKEINYTDVIEKLVILEILMN